MTFDLLLASLSRSVDLVVGGVIFYIPLIILSLIIFALGLMIAKGVAELVEKAIGWTKFDTLLSKTGVKTFFDRAGFRLDTGHLLGGLTRWTVVLVTTMIVTDILGLEAVTDTIKVLIAYIPVVVVGSAILAITVLFGNFLQKVVRGSIVGANLKAANFIGSLVKWIVFVLGFLMALKQLRIETTLLDNIVGTVVQGVVYMITIAGGISFGLAGKDFAHDLLAKFRDEIEE
ncbi:MAG: TM helix repeat-containing protein [Parcubacteria group bacterium GW2011_GWA2_46_7]|nr:MAG: TM helix repeat-containing protein [Parcubacteria group bacterium GW2011_GWF1_45_5]KKU11305.1 MAG: TM helix repeat-containing protein [Parcubacteria group bacterium GW2011_GWA1_45_7]KKU43924.1 MAG: TM helix repeat-containing protein [Parcubacteria group bacterium GW2011_GWA2_46_7]